jgi:hypothetical protein
VSLYINDPRVATRHDLVTEDGGRYFVQNDGGDLAWTVRFAETGEIAHIGTGGLIAGFDSADAAIAFLLGDAQ